ncbi:MAG: hypothetical protein KAR39_12830 [Thermoplasmata archaeon]|nr:hypothetical protein [Thermoplasmata archaeon]
MDVPVAHDLREDVARAVKDYSPSKNMEYHPKLYHLLRAVLSSVRRTVDDDTRKKPFYPSVRVPCSHAEETAHMSLKDRVNLAWFRVLVDRELHKALDVGIGEYVELEKKECAKNEIVWKAKSSPDTSG